MLPKVKFTVDDAQHAYDEWGANCGPGAVAAVLGMTLDEVRPHLGDFERKGYINPTLMWSVLRSVGSSWNRALLYQEWWPDFGLARVQWEGPWTKDGVPIAARYRHTHWTGVCNGGAMIFDINCLCVGGWVTLNEWSGEVVPWLLKQCEPMASGGWHITHSVEIARR